MQRFYDAITEFIFMKDAPARAEVIFVPGGQTGVHAVTAGRLYREGYADLLLPSGRFGKETGYYTGPEADRFFSEWEYLRDLLIREGVPEAAILREDRATYTWENAIYSRKVLETLGGPPKQALLCVQAHHARRAWMYYQQQFPDTRIRVIPTVSEGIAPQNWFLDERKTAVVLGEVERIGRQFHCVLPVKG